MWLEQQGRCRRYNFRFSILFIYLLVVRMRVSLDLDCVPFAYFAVRFFFLFIEIEALLLSGAYFSHFNFTLGFFSIYLLKVKREIWCKILRFTDDRTPNETFHLS